MKKIITKGIKYLKDSNYRFLINSSLELYNNMSDEEYLNRKFKALMGYEFDLQNPKTFNEKLQWLKLNDRKDIYTTMVDKYKVRDYVKEKLGEKYLIPLIGVWDNPNDIDFSKLPNKFVLKCNHNSGLGMCICKNKSKLNISKVKKNLKKGLKQDYYLTAREWPYKNVERKIICEKFMEDTNQSEELIDYKFMCFNGKVEYIFTCTDRFNNEGLKVTFFDTKWNVMPFERDYPKSVKKINKPLNFEKMIELAEKLSKNIPFVRVDFYEINEKIYFGELTFFPGAGFEKFQPMEWDLKIGEMIDLK